MKRWCFLLISLICLASPAYGSSILGDTVKIDYSLVNAGTVILTDTGTVNPSLDWYVGNGAGDVIINANGTITISNTTQGWAGEGGFNGFVFTDLTQDPNFSSLSLVSETGNLPPVDPILTFNSDQLIINFNASSANNGSVNGGMGQFYTFAFTPATTSVPEPATMLLLGLGLMGVLGIRRKIQK